MLSSPIKRRYIIRKWIAYYTITHKKRDPYMRSYFFGLKRNFTVYNFAVISHEDDFSSSCEDIVPFKSVSIVTFGLMTQAGCEARCFCPRGTWSNYAQDFATDTPFSSEDTLPVLSLGVSQVFECGGPLRTFKGWNFGKLFTRCSYFSFSPFLDSKVILCCDVVTWRLSPQEKKIIRNTT